MTATLDAPEQRVVLHNISWDLYESLLLAHRECRVPRFTYDRGELEIVSPSSEHEQLVETITLFVNIVAEEMELNVKGFGSTTFRLRRKERGFEPDSCFYIKNLGPVRGKKKIDLRTDPPPDLVIEVDITSSSLDKLAIFAALRIPEVWHFENDECRILILYQGKYVERTSSASFPCLTAETINRLVQESRTLGPLAWIRRVREWIRSV